MNLNDTNKKRLKLFIGIVLSITGLYWVFYDFNLHSLINIMKHTNPYFIVLSVFILIITIIIRSYVWKYLLNEGERITVYSLYKGELIGYFGNNVLPFKFGEFVRTYYVSKEYNIQKSSVFVTVVLERFLDIGCLVVLTSIMVAIYDLPIQINMWIHLYLKILLLGLFCIFIVIISLMIVYKNKYLLQTNKYLNRLLSYFRIQYLFKPFLFSMILWMFYLGYTYSVQQALNLNMSISQTLLLLVLSALVQIIPSAPGTFGTYHAAVKFTMVNIFGFETEISVVMAILLHSISYVLFTVLGAIYFVKAQIDISDIYKKSTSNTK